VPLLPEEAQWAIGQLHPVSELPFSILLDEGFDAESYLDIFDGGPTAEARVALLKTVAASRRLAPAAADTTGLRLLASTQRAGFSAVLRQGNMDIDRASAERLHLPTTGSVRTAPLVMPPLMPLIEPLIEPLVEPLNEPLNMPAQSPGASA